MSKASGLRVRSAVFMGAWFAVWTAANVASAQTINLQFLDLSAGTIKAIFDHNVWGYGLGAAVIWELIMFGLNRRVLHVIGMLVPGIALAAWLNRSDLISGMSGFTW